MIASVRFPCGHSNPSIAPSFPPPSSLSSRGAVERSCLGQLDCCRVLLAVMAAHPDARDLQVEREGGKVGADGLERTAFSGIREPKHRELDGIVLSEKPR